MNNLNNSYSKKQDNIWFFIHFFTLLKIAIFSKKYAKIKYFLEILNFSGLF